MFTAVILRSWKIDSVPPNASMDESSIGYNAYSVFRIGIDEYGQIPILSHRSYDDWRRATYLYMVLPFILFLDLKVISVRLPSIILSVFTICALYFIVRSLFKKQSVYTYSISLLASFLLAISPWHIYLSRIGHESNAYLSFFVFSVLFFLMGGKKNIFISVPFFILAMISYYAGQALVPIFIVGIIIIFRNEIMQMLFKDKKLLLISIIVLFFIAIIMKELFSPEAMIRFRGTSTFNPEVHQNLFNKRVELSNKAKNNNNIFEMFIYNRRLFPVQVFFEAYLSHFNPRWLFFSTPGAPHKIPNMGLLYNWQFPFILIGIYIFIRNININSKFKQVVFLWALLAPLPGGLATQAPHAMRSYVLLPVLELFTAFGLLYIHQLFKGTQRYLELLFLIVIGFSLVYFYQNYFIIFPREQSQSFQYASSNVIPYVLSRKNEYKSIIFSNIDNLYQSYMLFLYQSKYDPLLYQKQGGTKSGGYAEEHAFGKYEFKPINNLIKKGKTMYIGNVYELQNKGKLIAEFKSLNGNVDILVVETNE